MVNKKIQSFKIEIQREPGMTPKNPTFNKQSINIAYWNMHGLKQDKAERFSTFWKLFNENQ